MSGKKNSVKDFENALACYEIIKEALIGLTEITHVNFSKDDIFYGVALDNIQAIHDAVNCILDIYNPYNEQKKNI
ncbi:MAG: hypothetical protein ACTSU4_05520 [Promethearchaeota archaeon]